MEALAEYKVQHRTQSPYQDVRYPDGSLAFRIDPQRMIVEIQYRREKHYFDLQSICKLPIDNLE
jgi:hypothetical protein